MIHFVTLLLGIIYIVEKSTIHISPNFQGETPEKNSKSRCT